jgi:hypothetical protein
MARHRVAVFKQYPFEPGQKIHIADGPRRGDWEAVAADAREVTLRCPLSGRELTWKRFCYLVEEREAEWPAEE